jgi:hypothetical protein
MTAFGSARETRVGIDGADFTINGTPTYEGTRFEGRSIEGLLLNARMVQALFDDENPETRDRWAYPDTGEFDPDRNVAEFVDALPAYHDHGLRAVTVNLQCGNPNGYSPEHPQVVSAYEADGSLKDAWLDRLERVLDAADEVGMVVILGLFYQGQDDRLRDDDAVRAGVENVIDWLLDREYTNVLIEINNECDALPGEGWGYERDALKPGRVHELIELVQSRERDGFSYPASTSFTGGTVPSDNVLAAADFALLHGNGVDDPWRIGEMVEETRTRPSFEEMPVVFNEDDHYDFRSHPNNMLVALQHGASWGFYDAGRNNYRDGYQSPPVEWGINTERKREFFEYVQYVVDGSPG